MSSTWASVVPAGTVPKDYPRHFDGLSARPGASVSRRSPRSRAHRGPRAGFSGSWSRRRPGPATASQSLQQSAELVAQDQRRPPAGHCRRHNQQSGELVDQGQQIEVSAGHEPEDVAPVSSSTRASDASDARRSHRSVEGDEKPHGERERETHREKPPILYKSV